MFNIAVFKKENEKSIKQDLLILLCSKLINEEIDIRFFTNYEEYLQTDPFFRENLDVCMTEHDFEADEHGRELNGFDIVVEIRKQHPNREIGFLGIDQKSRQEYAHLWIPDLTLTNKILLDSNDIEFSKAKFLEERMKLWFSMSGLDPFAIERLDTAIESIYAKDKRYSKLIEYRNAIKHHINID